MRGSPAALERLSRPGEPAAPAGRRAEGRSGSGPDRRMERGMNMSRWFIRPVRLRLLGGLLSAVTLFGYALLLQSDAIYRSTGLSVGWMPMQS